MIYKEIQEKLENRRYADITTKDYEDLLINLGQDHHAKALHADPIPADLFVLRNWVYNRIAKDEKYQEMGYLNEHCCIGIIYGMLRMFDEANYEFNRMSTYRSSV